MMFSKLEDSPMFRKQLLSLEESADSLRERCNKLGKSSRKYTESVGESHQMDVAFASALDAFSSLDDPIAIAVGGPVMTKFVVALKEVASFKETLKSQVEHMLNDRITKFKDMDLQNLKDVRKRFDKSSQQYDQVREKFLSLKKDTRADIVQEAEEDLHVAKMTFEQARFNLVTALCNIESKKKFEFLESIGSTMDAHLRYFKQGYELLHSLEPYIHQVLTYSQQARERANHEQAALAERMYDYRKQKELESQRGGAAVEEEEAAASGGGPLQSLGHSTQKLIEHVMNSTPPGKVQVIKQGYLLKRSSNLRGDWKRRFFVLDSRGTLYYYRKQQAKPTAMQSALQTSVLGFQSSVSGLLHSKPQDPLSSLFTRMGLSSRDKDSSSSSSASSLYTAAASSSSFSNSSTPSSSPPHESGFPHPSLASISSSSAPPLPPSSSFHGDDKSLTQHTLNLLTATIKMDAEQSDLRFCFRIISPNKTYTLQAENAAERMDWMEKITGVIASLLNQQMSEPSRSSHSGHLSREPVDGASGVAADLSERISYVDRPLDVLCQVAGNHSCIDCGAPGPDWASLNLGVLMCIECSGIHRNLGVHISKVRSLTLDVKAWETSVVAYFTAMGNQFANSVWEMLLEDELDNDEEGYTSLRSDNVVGKPRPRDSLQTKEKFIHAKYLERCFMLRGVDQYGGQLAANRSMWQAVEEGSVQTAHAMLLTADLDANLTFEAAYPNAARGQWVGAATSSEKRGEEEEGEEAEEGEEEGEELRDAGESDGVAGKNAGSGGGAAGTGTASTAGTAGTAGTPAKKQWFKSMVGRRTRHLSIAEDIKMEEEEGRSERKGARGTRFASMGGERELEDGSMGAWNKGGSESGGEGGEGRRGRLSGGVREDDMSGYSLLHLACKGGDVALVEMLLQFGASIDQVDANGRTALHVCLLHGNSSSAKLLISRGARTSLKDKSGRTPLEALMEKGGGIADNDLIIMLAE